MKKHIIKCRPDIVKLAFEIALTQKGLTEIPKNSNCGAHVIEYQKAAHIRPKDPYCMAGWVWCFKEAIRRLGLDRDTYMPFPSQGSANKCFDYARDNGREVIPVRKKYDLFVYKHKNKYSGHIGGILLPYVDKSGDPIPASEYFDTFEFNTSADDKGDQRNGGGNFEKIRNEKTPLGMLYLRGYIGFEWDED